MQPPLPVQQQPAKAPPASAKVGGN
jgi:hypothetical protein